MIDRGAVIDSPDKSGITPLIWAALEGHAPAVKVLLDRGARVNAISSNCWTALMAAAYHGHAQAVRLLVERGADIDRIECTLLPFSKRDAITMARNRGHTAIVELLKDARQK